MINYILLFIFIVAYIGIAAEAFIKINKTAIALVCGTSMWLIYWMFLANNQLNNQLSHSFFEIASIAFFLLGAMIIVVLIDLYEGFTIIVDLIPRRKFLFFYSSILLFTFFLSAVLDNLTSTIIMVTIIGKILKKGTLKNYIISMVIVAANAGGVWSPIGDVTTTMLWMGHQVTSIHLINKLLLPAIISLLVPAVIVYFILIKQKLIPKEKLQVTNTQPINFQKSIVLLSGITLLLAVPALKLIFNIPPFISILFVSGILWLALELLNNKKKHIESKLDISIAMHQVDLQSILFFVGILLAVGVLEHTMWLHKFNSLLVSYFKNDAYIAAAMGGISAVIDNVPIVAAAKAMFPLSQFKTDHLFWLQIAFATGTGGSILVIGSAAGVVAMGIEKIDFFWYLKNISLPVLIGALLGFLIL
jgi:Na+/H+ antiporter NhaD/arsenite permease-like protein